MCEGVIMQEETMWSEKKEGNIPAVDVSAH